MSLNNTKQTNKIHNAYFLSELKKNVQHVQRSVNLWCYRKQLISLHGIIKYFTFNSVYNILNLIIVFTVCFTSEDVNKTSTIPV